MHTTVTKNCTFIHNGDCSGDIEIVRNGSARRLLVEWEDLVTFVGEMIRGQQIAEMEQKPAFSILGLKRGSHL